VGGRHADLVDGVDRCDCPVFAVNSAAMFAALRGALAEHQACIAEQLAALEQAEMAMERLQTAFATDAPAEPVGEHQAATSPASAPEIATTAAICPQCSSDFEVPRRGGRRQVYCGPDCKRAAMQARQTDRRRQKTNGANGHPEIDHAVTPTESPKKPCAYCEEPHDRAGDACSSLCEGLLRSDDYAKARPLPENS
jgi:hypothetical protein